MKRKGLFILVLSSLFIFALTAQSLAKTIVYARPFLGNSIDPATHKGTESIISLNEAYEGLVTTENGRPVSRLALSWQNSPDYKEWTFKLRPGVKFHNGTPSMPMP